MLRVDGSGHLGMGHVMRCLALASALEGAGARPIFAMRAYNPRVSQVVGAAGFDVKELPPDLTAEADARQTARIAEQTGAGLVVTDLWHRPALANPSEWHDYHRFLRDRFFLVGIASGQLTDIPADIVVYPYITGGDRDPCVNGSSTLLLGPSYFVFRPEFVDAAGAERTINGEARRVLVLVGGSDEPHLTARIVESLLIVGKPGLSLKVVLGATFSDDLRRDAARLLTDLDGDYEFIEHDANLVQAMLWADLAITGDGLVKYETAVTGTPSVVVSRPGSEDAMNRSFEQAGTTLHLGDGCSMSPEALGEGVRRVLDDHGLRTSMSRKGKSLLDGRGGERIVSHIPPGVLA